MKALRISGWTCVALGAVWILNVMMAVASGAEAYRALASLPVAIGFHAAFAVAGATLLGAAARKKAAAEDEGLKAAADAAPTLQQAS